MPTPPSRLAARRRVIATALRTGARDLRRWIAGLAARRAAFVSLTGVRRALHAGALLTAARVDPAAAARIRRERAP